MSELEEAVFNSLGLFLTLDAKLNLDGGCVKSILPPSAAEFSLDGDLFFMISRSEIMKNKSPSKYYLARSAKKNLFTQSLLKSVSRITSPVKIKP